MKKTKGHGSLQKQASFKLHVTKTLWYGLGKQFIRVCQMAEEWDFPLGTFLYQRSFSNINLLTVSSNMFQILGSDGLPKCHPKMMSLVPSKLNKQQYY